MWKKQKSGNAVCEKTTLSAEVQLSGRIQKEILRICEKYHCSDVILFGSRARGDAVKTSDIDLAVRGASDFPRLSAELIYNEFTLLPIDVIDLDEDISETLRQDIIHEGISLMS